MTVNINWLWLSRIAKVLALLLFFMPWMVVSCNGTALIEASGYQLATGNPTVAQMPMAEMNGKGDDMDPVWWVIVAAVVILAGIALSFVVKGAKSGGRVLLASSLVALALLGGGMSHSLGKMKSEMTKSLEEEGMDEMTRSMAMMMSNAIKIETQTGYWLTLVMLGLAGGAAAVTLVGGRGRETAPNDLNVQGGS